MKRIYFIIFSVLFNSISYSQIEFTEVANIFVGNDEAIISYADVDDDGYLDVFISGWNYTDYDNTRYYKNDGVGNFSEVENTPFLNLYGDIKLIDIDNDGDIDLYISPYFASNTSHIFLNDGAGSFSELTNHNINNSGTSAFADIDGDNDLDLFVAGSDTNEFFINDGSGVFTTQNFPFEPVEAYTAAVAFTDIDGDNDQDLIVLGNRSGPYDNTRLFANDGNGNYTILTIFPPFTFGSVNFADIDGDNDQDVLLTGSGSVSNLYTNLGNGDFENCPSTIIGVSWGDADFGDVDNDGELELLLCGQSAYGPTTKLFKQNFINVYTEVSTGITFKQLGTKGDVALLDYDNDDDLDAIVAGSYSGVPRTGLYENSLNNLGTNNEMTHQIFSIYPVPTSGVLKVNSGEPIFKIEVYNRLGQYLLGSLNIESIDLSILKQDVYFVKIIDKEGYSETKKIVKK